MKLYLLRHGRTAWNEAGKIQGRTDIPLGEEGRRSALEAGAALADIPFSAAFSSPLRRAKETAEIILGARKDILRTDERLIELNFGAAEGMCTMDASLLRLVQQQRITKETALTYSIHYEAMEKRLAALAAL